MRIFGAAMLILFVVGAPVRGEESRSGFHGDGFGLELSGAVALANESEGNSMYWSGQKFPQWELGLRIRIGEFFSIGLAAETVSKSYTGAEFDEKRQQIGVELQWRFRLTRIVRPWVSVGMSWGTVERIGTDEFYQVSGHVWEFLRLGVGCDVVVLDNLAIGPAVRVGRAKVPDDGSNQTALQTVVVGLRVTVAAP